MADDATSHSTKGKVPDLNDTFSAGSSDTRIPRSTNERHNQFAKELADELDGLDNLSTGFRSPAQLKQLVAEKKRVVAQRTGVSFGSLPKAQQAALGNLSFVAARRTAEEISDMAPRDVLKVKVRPEDAKNAFIAGLGVTPNGDASDFGYDRADAVESLELQLERAKAEGERSAHREERDSNARGRGFFAPRSEAPASKAGEPDAPPVKAPEKLDPDEAKRHREKGWRELFGIEGTAGRKLREFGDLDPYTLGPGKVVDASKYHIRAPIIRRLTARGVVVINAPGTERKDFAGYSKRELATGRLAGAGSTQAGARLEGARGLFRRKKVYETDANGNPVRIATLDPKYSVGGAKAAVKGATIGYAKRSIESSKLAREEKKLQNPLYRSRKVLRLERNRHLIQLQGELEDRETSGFRRWYLTQRVRLTSFALLNYGWLAFILGLAVFFVPWLGLLTWTGWGLAALAMTIMKLLTLVIVQGYNAVASAMVSVINLAGNFVSGIFEAGTTKILDILNLQPIVCSTTNGVRTCDDRLFHYTFSKVDTVFPGFPEFTKPAVFDTRTLIDVVLRQIGISYSWGNQLRKVLFPTEG